MNTICAPHEVTAGDLQLRGEEFARYQICACKGFTIIPLAH